jgi:hypothetical protein
MLPLFFILYIQLSVILLVDTLPYPTLYPNITPKQPKTPHFGVKKTHFYIKMRIIRIIFYNFIVIFNQKNN